MHLIPLSTAVTLTSSYRANKENILITSLRNQKVTPLCETFDRSAIDTLLAQSGCASIRIYPGMDSAGKIKFVIVGVTSAGEDLLAHDPIIVEDGQRCPDLCPPSSVLNS